MTPGLNSRPRLVPKINLAKTACLTLPSERFGQAFLVGVPNDVRLVVVWLLNVVAFC